MKKIIVPLGSVLGGYVKTPSPFILEGRLLEGISMCNRPLLKCAGLFSGDFLHS